MALTALPSTRTTRLPRVGSLDLWRPVDFLHRRGSQPVDPSSIAVFRIAFGTVALIAIVRFFAYGWIDQLYVDPLHHFSYVGFEWVRAWPSPWMHLHFAALGALSIAIILGWRARASLVLFALGFTYVELIDKTTYLNHYYFVSLTALLLAFIPHDRAWSLDARRSGFGWTPAWTVWVLRAQIALVYCFAGFAKLNHDWIVNAAPLRFWLPQHAHLPVIGPLLDETWVAYAFSWAGAAFDLTIVAWMLWGRSRPLAFAVLIVFHLITGQLFLIGVFPYMMIAASLIFFSPDWPRRLLSRFRTRSRTVDLPSSSQPTTSTPSLLTRLAVLIALALLTVQIVVPLRHYLYPGPVQWNEEGYPFSWRVLLTEKVGHVEYRVTDAQGRSWTESPARYLSPLQAERMTTQPDLILATAHFIRDHYAQQGRQVSVAADAFVSFNGRASQRLIDPDADLAREPQGIGPKPWILPPP